jgi:hypothetical protein
VSLHPSDADRAAFVKSLKPSDTVCIFTDTRGTQRFTKATVERITPKGAFRIREVGGDSILNFDSHGTRRSGGTWGWYDILEPWTSEVEAHLARIRLVNSVLFYLDRSVVDREAVEALSEVELKTIVMSLRPLRKKDA